MPKRFKTPERLVIAIDNSKRETNCYIDEETEHAHIGGGYQPYAVHDFLKGGTFTVSYTHLDVYKRQVFGLTVFASINDVKSHAHLFCAINLSIASNVLK